MSKKYTDEQLSRILGEHSAGQLISAGAERWSVKKCDLSQCPVCEGRPATAGCINQVAYNSPDNATADCLNKNPAAWFDECYIGSMTPEELLKNLEYWTKF